MGLSNLKFVKTNVDKISEKEFNVFSLCWFMFKSKNGEPCAFGLGFKSGENFVDCKSGKAIDLNCGRVGNLGYAFALNKSLHFDYVSKVASGSYKISINPIKFKLNNAFYSVMPCGFADVDKLWQSQSSALSGFRCDSSKLYIDKNLVYNGKNVDSIYFEEKINEFNVPFVFINLKYVKGVERATNKNIFKSIQNGCLVAKENEMLSGKVL